MKPDRDLINVTVQIPKEYGEQALKLAWYDGVRTGAFAVGLLAIAVFILYLKGKS